MAYLKTNTGFLLLSIMLCLATNSCSQDGGTLYGQVVDHRFFALHDVGVVDVINNNKTVTSTNKRGEYELDLVDKATYGPKGSNVTLSKTGYKSFQLEIYPGADDTDERNIMLPAKYSDLESKRLSDDIKERIIYRTDTGSCYNLESDECSDATAAECQGQQAEFRKDEICETSDED